jgi:hypothetical protein
MHFHRPESNLHESAEPSFHRSAMSTSDNPTVIQSAIPSRTRRQGHGQEHGNAQNLVGGLMKQQSNRKGSPSSSQIPRPSLSPVRTTRSPTPSQPRAQTTPVPSTSSKLGQSAQNLTSIRVEYSWGAEGDIRTSGTLNLNASEVTALIRADFEPGTPLRSLHARDWQSQVLAFRSG